MVSPNISRKTEILPELTLDAKKLFQVIYTEQTKAEDKSTPKIKVSELISKMSFYYEKIRNTVDYEEEYLLRKNAIERILRRQILIEGVLKISKSEEMSKHLLIELIRAGYLPNNKVPETKIKEIGLIIEKYIKLRNYTLARIKPAFYLKKGEVGKMRDELKERNSLTSWFLALAASEIEASLGRDRVKEVVVSNMYDILKEKIEIPEKLEKYKKDLEIQIYISIHRVYLKFDQAMLSLILFKYYNGAWKDPKDEDIAKIAQDILLIKQAIEAQLDHPLSKQIDKITNKYNVYFSILTDVIDDDPVNVFDSIKNDPKAFPRLIKNMCKKKYRAIKSKLWRVASRSIVYIFITKSVFAILLEVPAIRFFGEEINPVSLAVNVSFPAVLLFVIVVLTGLPSDENTNKIIEGINSIIFKKSNDEEKYKLHKPSKRGPVINFIFNLFYTITFFLSFGAVIWGLGKLDFNWVSITIFLFFLALVSYFGIKIKKSASELTVVEDKENIVSFFTDFFYTPIVAVGKWLSEKFSRINVFVFILDFIIEAPFKVFVEMAEEWTKYVKERKEELR